MSNRTDTSTGTDLVDPMGRVWHRGEQEREGAPLYYVDGAPASCPPWVMSTRDELEELFGAPMTPQAVAA